MDRSPTDSESELPAVPFREAVRVWLRVAALSFGGPAGQIAVMQRILVDEKRWIGPRRFLHALNYCMLLPGPEAQQLATYSGWLLHGTAGGLVAGSLFVLPGFLAILAMSYVYVLWGATPLVAAVFLGLKPAVLAVVVDALVRVGRRALGSAARVALAGAAFLALFAFDLPFPWIVVGAALIGWLGGRAGVRGLAAEGAAKDGDAGARRPPLGRSLRTAAIWLAVWWIPVAALVGRDSVLVTEGLFFSSAAVLTFGGAYAVLAFIAQKAVEEFGWLAPGEMLDGLGLAETTPGPLIMVVQFVGFLGAWRDPGTLAPWLAGLLGAVVTTWVTFAPCFLWIFLGAPYIEWLRGRRGLSDALTAVTAAVVGVILNLSVWFALHTLFGAVERRAVGPLVLHVPELATLDPAAATVAILSFALLFGLRWGMLPTLGAGVAGGLLWTLGRAPFGA